MEFQEAITACFKKYATFTGRATRAEYWWFQLFMSAVQAVSIALVISAYTISGTLGTLAVLFWLLFSLAAIIPCLSVTVRRLHDRGFSGWWLLPATIIITLLPISAIAWLIIMSLPSGPSNKYGDVPCMADSF
ncbi:MAG: DUF805 domain-containing protein [Desulfovibrionaceae bacterium]|nr:DUF805 domain-containing protein [Desulfovibrionaceae bacterium]